MPNQKRLVKIFTNLVEIDSPSGNEERVSQFIEKRLKKLKIKFSKDKAGNLIANIEGKGEPVLLAAHMDTVDPCFAIQAEVRGDIIKSKGETILGADDKAGIAEILEAITVLKEKKLKHRPLEIVFTREEETGIVGASKLNKKDFKAKQGLVLDGENIGEITMASPFVYQIDIKIKGRSAHAGMEPEKGISAIKVAAEAISKLAVGRIDKETTNNIGSMQSGKIRNGVPEDAVIKAEARSHNLRKAQKQIELYKKAFTRAAKKYQAKLDFNVKLNCYGYKYNKTDKFIQKIAKEFERLNIKPRFVKVGGASDVNAFVRLGIKAVDISYGGKNCHTTRESIKISYMVKITEFLINFLQK
ncbi:MAG: M20/M25/M40 family metallo-hydrolase [Candidatus Moranbacteria bacterium]|nr:M20/M25/M40 family metallo-hydrolase [Candidatus Moranbacteria bacterium]